MKTNRRFRVFQAAEPIPAAPGGITWQKFMTRALIQANLALEAGEIPVGALIIDAEGKVIAEACNKMENNCDPTAHAEILAIRMAATKINNWRLPKCVLVTTLEPCLMCAGAISHARLTGVVFGAYDAYAGAISSNLDCLDMPHLNTKIWHMGGIMAQECKQLLDYFFNCQRQKR